MNPAQHAAPFADLSVVELARGVSDLGLGMVAGVPGMLLSDLGARVLRIVDPQPTEIDRDVAWGRAWHRDKQLQQSCDVGQIRQQLLAADIALVYGDEALIEQVGLGYAELSRANPKLIYGRCRPSRTSRGSVADYGLLVEAQSGFCSQLQGHRKGPIFVDVRASGAGASFLMTSSVLALLRRRILTGAGGYAETSLYDGMLATLGTMIGRAERAPEHVASYWAKGSTFPNFMYRCADDELIQVWFGGKGMYEKLIRVLGDEPSSAGYYAEQVSGLLNERALRWRSLFASQPRSVWMERLRAEGIACEPVLAPGDALADPHLAAAGIALARTNGAHRDLVVGSGIEIVPVAAELPAPTPLDANGGAIPRGAGLPSLAADGGGERHPECPQTLDAADGGSDRRPDKLRSPAAASGGMLAGVRVLDFSAFVAGPLSAQVLADLGADVIKVEPPEGEAMRAAAYAVAACQRGKRSIAIDITAPSARPVVERLLRWADVVLHNFRVGVSERLGIDEASVARLNPSAVYCHSSAFGASGPRALLPGNDALMQALTGFERAIGGAGNEPIAATWIPIDMAGGWVGAIGVLAGLCARAKEGRGQVANTSLLGAGMLLQSGVYQRDDVVVRQPELDREQTGYGPGYRLYECADGEWLALVIPNHLAWQQVSKLPECRELPDEYIPIRRSPTDEAAIKAEAQLAAAFRSATAETWVSRLAGLGAYLQPARNIDRECFRSQIIDDPLNQQLGRVIAYQVRAWGHFEQLGSLMRCGPNAGSSVRKLLPEVGEHSSEILAALGFEPAEITQLIESKIVRQLR